MIYQYASGLRPNSHVIGRPDISDEVDTAQNQVGNHHKDCIAQIVPIEARFKFGNRIADQCSQNGDEQAQ